MSRPFLSSFVTGAVLTAAISGAALFIALRSASIWAACGFAAMAIPIVASGAWLARAQGRPGAGFVVAMGAGLTLRVALLSIVVAAAAYQGGQELTQALTGLAFGFLPLTIFELIWLARRTRSAASPVGSSR